MTETATNMVAPRSGLYLLLNELHAQSGAGTSLIEHIVERRNQGRPASFENIAFDISAMSGAAGGVVSSRTVRNWYQSAVEVAA